MPEALWELRDVTYGTRIQGITGAIARGRAVALVGPSGAGKSTLLQLLVRLLEPTFGEICYKGRPLTAWDPLALRREAVLVPQRAVAFPGTVADNLCLGRLGRREPCPREAWEGLLETLGLPRSYGEREARQLSGGELARVALGRALLLQPQVLLLDEVTAGLDTATVQAVGRVMEAFLEAGEGLLFAAHDLHLVAEWAHEVWVLDEGRLVEQNEVQAFFSQPSSATSKSLLEAWGGRLGRHGP
ncbi:MAG: ATP-binding cassette domain-containing protein [Bacillota bacterium]|nr:ATP-binding cassette domain-containing protein [Bacillota bacterium]